MPKRFVLILIFLGVFISKPFAQVISEMTGMCAPTLNLSVCLYAFDSKPLSHRSPIVLVHGWNYKEIPGHPIKDLWGNFKSFYDSEPELYSKFKLYELNYYSNDITLKDMSGAFASILGYFEGFERGNVVIIAHSMGGLLARGSLGFPAPKRGFTGDRVSLLITLGTPHHGTVLANGPAIYDHISPHWFPLLPIISSSIKPSWSDLSRSEILWDNFDGILDYLAYASEYNDFLVGLNKDTSFDNKITAYGGKIEKCDDAGILYCLGDKLIEDVLGVDSDGMVPVSSSLFYTDPQKANSRFRTRHLYDHDHSQIAKGRGDDVLFEIIKHDLLSIKK